MRVLNDDEQAECDAIIADIESAFRDVTRGDAGVSWNECVAIDDWKCEDECQAARRTDTDLHWTEFAYDTQWNPFPGVGGFSFINLEGFRYYLPAMLIRALTDDLVEANLLLLHLPRFTAPEQRTHWTDDQLCCIARFMRFMATHDEWDSADWESALDEGGWSGCLPTD